jgi:hypothetical protein
MKNMILILLGMVFVLNSYGQQTGNKPQNSSFNNLTTAKDLIIIPDSSFIDNTVWFYVSDTTRNIHASISNFQGRVLVSHKFPANTYSHNVSLLGMYLNSGTYFLKIESDGFQTVKNIELKD